MSGIGLIYLLPIYYFWQQNLAKLSKEKKVKKAGIVLVSPWDKVLDKSRGVWFDVMLVVSSLVFVGIKRDLQLQIALLGWKVSVLAGSVLQSAHPASLLLEDAAAAAQFVMIFFGGKTLPWSKYLSSWHPSCLSSVCCRRAVGHTQLCPKHYWGKAFCHLSAKTQVTFRNVCWCKRIWQVMGAAETNKAVQNQTSFLLQKEHQK